MECQSPLFPKLVNQCDHQVTFGEVNATIPIALHTVNRELILVRYSGIFAA